VHHGPHLQRREADLLLGVVLRGLGFESRRSLLNPLMMGHEMPTNTWNGLVVKSHGKTSLLVRMSSSTAGSSAEPVLLSPAYAWQVGDDATVRIRQRRRQAGDDVVLEIAVRRGALRTRILELTRRSGSVYSWV
jgi:hypothetical protein